MLNKFRCCGICSKISVDMLPVVLIPLLTLMASMSFTWTLGIFICTAVGLYFVRRKFAQIKPRSTFFTVWLLTSVLWLILIFNIFVIALMEILPEENFILVILIIASLGCLYHSKMKSQKTLLPFNKASYIDRDMNDKDIDDMISVQNIEQPFFCRHCQANVQHKNHSVWLNCCIGPENESLFILGNIFGLLALVYGSNLALTTICHPFIFYYPFLRLLLPDDCSDVYFTNSTSISFVSAVYCTLIAVLVGWFLLKTLLRKLGFTRFKWSCSTLV